MCHVLIIEDEPLVAMDLEVLLEKEGATSFSFAVSQDEAIAAARTRRPDLITSDVTLVEGSGPLAVEEIHRELGTIPVIYITGTDIPCSCSHDSPVLTKPFDRGTIAEVFHRLVPTC